jgi:imidazoleglycerol phosphate synthase glutamine amidotransferase subunit HisH
MGWNNLIPLRSGVLVPRSVFVYFAHSYYCPVTPATAATCEYSGVTYTAALERDNLYGVQFHPEKSGPVGLQIVDRFVRC